MPEIEMKLIGTCDLVLLAEQSDMVTMEAGMLVPWPHTVADLEKVKRVCRAIQMLAEVERIRPLS